MYLSLIIMSCTRSSMMINHENDFVVAEAPRKSKADSCRFFHE